MVSLGDAVGIALGRRRRSPSWAVGFGNPRSQQHGAGEIIRSQYEAHLPHSWQLADIVDLMGPFEILERLLGFCLSNHPHPRLPLTSFDACCRIILGL